MNVKVILLANAAVTWYLVGLIWMVQIVHYRLMDRVGHDSFVRYESDHSRLITPIVGPPMLLELATSIALVIWLPDGIPRWWMMAGVALVILIWASTFVIQVPCHSKLLAGFDEQTYQLLVRSNWIRTVAWSLRGALCVAVLWQLLGAGAVSTGPR